MKKVKKLIDFEYIPENETPSAGMRVRRSTITLDQLTPENFTPLRALVALLNNHGEEQDPQAGEYSLDMVRMDVENFTMAKKAWEKLPFEFQNDISIDFNRMIKFFSLLCNEQVLDKIELGLLKDRTTCLENHISLNAVHLLKQNSAD